VGRVWLYGQDKANQPQPNKGLKENRKGYQLVLAGKHSPGAHCRLEFSATIWNRAVPT
jgi:hypothetical protein